MRYSIADLHPENGTVRVVFIAAFGRGNECPVKANDLDAAEVLFISCGMSADRAAALRAEVQRNKVASIETSVDEEVAAKFSYTKP